MEKLKASDLRIGNLLQDESSIILKVVGLSNFRVLRTPSVVCEALNDQVLREIDILPGEARPIPLSETILKEWRGFKEVPREGLQIELPNLPNKRLYIPMDNESEARIIWHSNILTIAKGISCLHQLQNLYFALTGQELTVNIP
jgi:hypothetical protein